MHQTDIPLEQKSSRDEESEESVDVDKLEIPVVRSNKAGILRSFNKLAKELYEVSSVYHVYEYEDFLKIYSIAVKRMLDKGMRFSVEGIGYFEAQQLNDKLSGLDGKIHKGNKRPAFKFYKSFKTRCKILWNKSKPKIHIPSARKFKNRSQNEKSQ